MESDGQVTLLDLTPELSADAFDDAERVIETGQQAFIEVGLALARIRDLGLREIRRRGYGNFEGYLQKRWPWTSRHSYRLMAAAETFLSLPESVTSMSQIGATQAHVLSELPHPLRAEVAQAIDFASTPVRELRRIVKKAKAEIAAKVEERRATELPKAAPLMPLPSDVALDVADAAALPLPDASIDLIVTSPPYGVGKGYGSADDADDWWSKMRVWVAEMYRVTREHGRLAINVPLDTTIGGYRPTYAQTVQTAYSAGWTYRTTIVWSEPNVSKTVARGSVDSPAAPHVIAPVEMIALFSRGDWKRGTPAGIAPDLTHEEWLDWTNGLWAFNGEGRAWEGHPAPFPEELPRRLIKLLSFPGDTVLDPFLGSGTTAVVAHRLGRKCYGYDLSAEYIESAKRRLGRLG